MCRYKKPFYLTLFALIATILWTRDFSLLRQLRSSSSTKPTRSPIQGMDLHTRLAALRPTIEKLMSIGGTAGLSLGVLHQGKQVHQANYGFRDVVQNLPVTEETIFPGCSLVKALTAAALGILVDEGKVQWDTLVKDILPDFQMKDSVLQHSLTISDLLCHRAGLSWGDNLYVGTENNVLIWGQDSMKYLNSLEPLLPFRGQFQYNNLPYELAGHIIEKVSGQPWPDLPTSAILKKLGLERTFFHTPPPDLDNVAKCYNTLDDGTPTPIPCVKTGDDRFGGPSGGLRSCVKDLLKLYGTFMTSFNDQFAQGTTSTKGSPLKQVNHLMSAKIPMNQPTRSEKSYAYGWARVQLPATMGDIGCNPPLMPKGMPVVGKGVASRLVVYHQGSLPGALAFVAMIPDTETAVVVLTNSLALNDTPDWVGQLVIEEILEVPERNDYVEAAKTSVVENAKWYPDTLKALQNAQENGTSPRKLEEYTGTYWDDRHVFKIDVLEENGSLYWKLQGLESEKFQLKHYQRDDFTWIQPRNDLAKRGRWVDQGPDFWKARFKSSKDTEIDELYWVHDIGVPAVKYAKELKGAL